ncbi:MAG: hypothetical protein AAFO07_01685 [Bacteroidota bacterium]
MKNEKILLFIFLAGLFSCSNNKETITNRAEIFEKNKETLYEIAKEFGYEEGQFSFDESSADKDELFTEKEKDSLRTLFLDIKAWENRNMVYHEKMKEFNMKRNEEYKLFEEKLSNVSTKRDTYLIYLDHPHLIDLVDSTDLVGLDHPRLKKK